MIWTKGAFDKVDSLFGTSNAGAEFKSVFNMLGLLCATLI